MKINKNKYKNNKYKYFFIIIFFFLYTKIVSEQKIINLKKHEMYFYKNEINYKGHSVLKQKLIDDFLSNVTDDYKSAKRDENIRFNSFYNLAIYSNNLTIQSELKTKFLKEVSRFKKRKITQLKTFFLSRIFGFGNSLIQINNAIFYCEVVKCNTIILNKYNLKRNWLITKDIYIEKLNITIKQDSNVDCSNINTFCFYKKSYDPFYPKIILPQIKTDLIKEEILRNLPNSYIDSEALYIHIRGGDIFESIPSQYYAQPPLCFYEKIINNKRFKKIYIVSMDTSNVVIDILTQKYKNIIHNINTMEYDLSLLSHAFHIVLSVSTFVISAIKLNDNLKDVWEYDIMRLSEKMLFLHHHLYYNKIKYKIYTMKPSIVYASKMFFWQKTPEQIKLMLEDDCPNDFIITKTNK